MSTYNKRTWLNRQDSPSTGNVVAYDGYYYCKYDNEVKRRMFLSVSDCNNSIRLHKTDDDTVEDFIKKMELLRDNISEFIEHLKSLY